MSTKQNPYAMIDMSGNKFTEFLDAQIAKTGIDPFAILEQAVIDFIASGAQGCGCESLELTERQLMNVQGNYIVHAFIAEDTDRGILSRFNEAFLRPGKALVPPKTDAEKAAYVFGKVWGNA